MTETPTTRSAKIAADVSAYLRARNPVLWIKTREEKRAEGHIATAGASAGFTFASWDVAAGVRTLDGRTLGTDLGMPGNGADPSDVLDAIADQAQNGDTRRMWVLRDLAPWLDGPAGARPRRQLRNLARTLPGVPQDRAQAVVVLTPAADVPPDIAADATVIDWPIPDRAELAAILDGIIAGIDPNKAEAPENGTREALLDAMLGLTGEQAKACISRALVQLRRYDPATVAEEKKRLVSGAGLTVYEANPRGLDGLGGLELLKAELRMLGNAYTPAARAYGLPAPRGMVLTGSPGCGKSETAKALAGAWGVPLILWDLGGGKSKYVGESEANIRRNQETIDTIGRCVVLIDEIEKALQGATSGSSDGGVASDQVQALLTWLNDRRGEAFIIATANDIQALAQAYPELLRRFDAGVWYVDLPTTPERAAILQTALVRHNRGALDINRGAVATVTQGFSGAEIARLVPAAMYAAFADAGREITTADLIAAARATVPLSKTAGDRLAAVRRWCSEGRARFASEPETRTAATEARQIEL